MLWHPQLLRRPDLHVSREMPTAQGFNKLEGVCVDSGDQHDGLRNSFSLQSGLSPEQAPEEAGGPGPGDWEMYPVSWQTQVVGKDP